MWLIRLVHFDVVIQVLQSHLVDLDGSTNFKTTNVLGIQTMTERELLTIDCDLPLREMVGDIESDWSTRSDIVAVTFFSLPSATFIRIQDGSMLLVVSHTNVEMERNAVVSSKLEPDSLVSVWQDCSFDLNFSAVRNSILDFGEERN